MTPSVVDAHLAQPVGELRARQAEPRIREIDVNPVFVYPAGHGAVALDALIYMD